MDKLKPSEVVEGFLNYLEKCKTEYEEAYDAAGEEDKRVQDFLHAMEFASNKQERNKIATQLHQSRKRRRTAKDKVLELQKVYDFYKDVGNKTVLKKLKGMIPKQKQTEEYLQSDREYKPRVGDAE